MPCLSQKSNSHEPPGDLLDACPFSLIELISGMARCAVINGALPVLRVLGDMRAYIYASGLPHKFLRAIRLVAPNDNPLFRPHFPKPLGLVRCLFTIKINRRISRIVSRIDALVALFLGALLSSLRLNAISISRPRDNPFPLGDRTSKLRPCKVLILQKRFYWRLDCIDPPS